MQLSHFAYACKTERQNGISRLISELLRTLDSSLRDHLFLQFLTHAEIFNVLFQHSFLHIL